MTSASHHPDRPPHPPSADRPRRATPHFREFLADSLTPVGAYRRLATLSPLRFLFESVTGGEQVSRFSFLGAAPREVYRLWPDRLERERDGHRETVPGAPLEALGRVLGGIVSEHGTVPFTGGFVGYFGYDTVRLVERLPDRPADPYGLPLALLARFDALAVFDHAHQRVLTVANEIEGEVDAAEAERTLARMADVLTAPAEPEGRPAAVPIPGPRPGSGSGSGLEPPATEPPSLSDDQFRAAVAATKDYIAAGDIFQTVLARRFRVARRVDPLALYRALRVINPSPYMVLLDTPDVALAGASPEMLVRKDGRRLETRPIAGTRPRGVDPAGDRRLARDLLEDPKERAEHVMLVDLGRNDLGRVAEPGSVEVASFMEIERYSHVMHLVSSVEGRIAGERSALDALLACFPAGTLSGAPKVRAMEIIDEMEPESRGPYGGAVGYLSYSGDLDTCITIRTLLVQGDETSVTAGAGIVADSDPDRERQETENKAAGMLAAVALAERIAAREAAPGGPGSERSDGPPDAEERP
ncbi:MAG: chorismate-binding protein [Acidobacteriota bacterium]|jgi:anthranilate synthase component 1